MKRRVPTRKPPARARAEAEPAAQQLARIEQQKAQSLGQAILRSARLLDEHAVSRVRDESGVSALRRAHTAVFPHLDFAGTRLSLLAERMGITKQAVNQLVDDLEAMAVVARQADPSDGRAKLIVFTAKGRRTLLHGLGILAAIEGEAAARMGQRKVRQLHQLLGEFIEVLETRAIGA